MNRYRIIISRQRYIDKWSGDDYTIYGAFIEALLTLQGDFTLEELKEIKNLYLLCSKRLRNGGLATKQCKFGFNGVEVELERNYNHGR